MNNDRNNLPENDKNAPVEKKDIAQEGPEISQPNHQEPVGPFEHSGETAGWTKEEENQEKSE